MTAVCVRACGLVRFAERAGSPRGAGVFMSSSNSSPPATSAAELLARFELAWSAIGDFNHANVTRAAGLAATARQAGARCDACAAGWRALQSELASLPGAVAELSAGVAAATARADALDRRLSEAIVSRVELREAAWRRAQLQEAEAAEARRHAEAAARAEASRAAAEADAVAKQRAAEREAAALAARAAAARAAEERERQSVFQEEYEARRREYLEAQQQAPPPPPPGVTPEMSAALRQIETYLEAKRQQTDSPAAPAAFAPPPPAATRAAAPPAPPAVPSRLADVPLPAVAHDEAALAAFYSDEEEGESHIVAPLEEPAEDSDGG